MAEPRHSRALLAERQGITSPLVLHEHGRFEACVLLRFRESRSRIGGTRSLGFHEVLEELPQPPADAIIGLPDGLGGDSQLLGRVRR